MSAESEAKELRRRIEWLQHQYQAVKREEADLKSSKQDSDNIFKMVQSNASIGNDLKHEAFRSWMEGQQKFNDTITSKSKEAAAIVSAISQAQQLFDQISMSITHPHKRGLDTGDEIMDIASFPNARTKRRPEAEHESVDRFMNDSYIDDTDSTFDFSFPHLQDMFGQRIPTSSFITGSGFNTNNPSSFTDSSHSPNSMVPKMGDQPASPTFPSSPVFTVSSSTTGSLSHNSPSLGSHDSHGSSKGSLARKQPHLNQPLSRAPQHHHQQQQQQQQQQSESRRFGSGSSVGSGTGSTHSRDTTSVSMPHRPTSNRNKDILLPNCFVQRICKLCLLEPKIKRAHNLRNAATFGHGGGISKSIFCQGCAETHRTMTLHHAVVAMCGTSEMDVKNLLSDVESYAKSSGAALEFRAYRIKNMAYTDRILYPPDPGEKQSESFLLSDSLHTRTKEDLKREPVKSAVMEFLVFVSQQLHSGVEMNQTHTEHVQNLIRSAGHRVIDDAAHDNIVLKMHSSHTAVTTNLRVKMEQDSTGVVRKDLVYPDEDMAVHVESPTLLDSSGSGMDYFSLDTASSSDQNAADLGDLDHMQRLSLDEEKEIVLCRFQDNDAILLHDYTRQDFVIVEPKFTSSELEAPFTIEVNHTHHTMPSSLTASVISMTSQNTNSWGMVPSFSSNEVESVVTLQICPQFDRIQDPAALSGDGFFNVAFSNRNRPGSIFIATIHYNTMGSSEKFLFDSVFNLGGDGSDDFFGDFDLGGSGSGSDPFGGGPGGNGDSSMSGGGGPGGFSSGGGSGMGSSWMSFYAKNASWCPSSLRQLAPIKAVSFLGSFLSGALSPVRLSLRARTLHRRTASFLFLHSTKGSNFIVFAAYALRVLTEYCAPYRHKKGVLPSKIVLARLLAQGLRDVPVVSSASDEDLEMAFESKMMNEAQSFASGSDLNSFCLFDYIPSILLGHFGGSNTQHMQVFTYRQTEEEKLHYIFDTVRANRVWFRTEKDINRAKGLLTLLAGRIRTLRKQRLITAKRQASAAIARGASSTLPSSTDIGTSTARGNDMQITQTWESDETDDDEDEEEEKRHVRPGTLTGQNWQEEGLESFGRAVEEEAGLFFHRYRLSPLGTPVDRFSKALAEKLQMELVDSVVLAVYVIARYNPTERKEADTITVEDFTQFLRRFGTLNTAVKNCYRTLFVTDASGRRRLRDEFWAHVPRHSLHEGESGVEDLLCSSGSGSYLIRFTQNRPFEIVVSFLLGSSLHHFAFMYIGDRYILDLPHGCWSFRTIDHFIHSPKYILDCVGHLSSGDGVFSLNIAVPSPIASRMLRAVEVLDVAVIFHRLSQDDRTGLGQWDFLKEVLSHLSAPFKALNERISVACNQIDKNGNTPLMRACIVGDKRAVEVLLSRSKQAADTVNTLGQTSRDLAVMYGRTEIVRVLDDFYGNIPSTSMDSRVSSPLLITSPLSYFSSRYFTFVPTHTSFLMACSHLDPNQEGRSRQEHLVFDSSILSSSSSSSSSSSTSSLSPSSSSSDPVMLLKLTALGRDERMQWIAVSEDASNDQPGSDSTVWATKSSLTLLDTIWAEPGERVKVQLIATKDGKPCSLVVSQSQGSTSLSRVLHSQSKQYGFLITYSLNDENYEQVRSLSLSLSQNQKETTVPLTTPGMSNRVSSYLQRKFPIGGLLSTGVSSSPQSPGSVSKPLSSSSSSLPELTASTASLSLSPTTTTTTTQTSSSSSSTSPPLQTGSKNVWNGGDPWKQLSSRVLTSAESDHEELSVQGPSLIH